LAWQKFNETGCGALDSLHKVATGCFITPISQMGPVLQLLFVFLENYKDASGIVHRLCEAYQTEGDGLSSTELDRLRRRLTDELRYDFRQGQDRFRLTALFGGSSYLDFIARLELMVSQMESVAQYERQLRDAMTGVEPTLRTRLDRFRSHHWEEDRRQIESLVNPPDPQGFSLLRLCRERPDVSASDAARKRLVELTSLPWFRLLESAVAEMSADGSEEQDQRRR
jgi:hypothetical protein